MNPNRKWLFVAAVVAVIAAGTLAFDYFTPVQLEVDANSPRFRLVRHRRFFADQEFEMSWKRTDNWSYQHQKDPHPLGRWCEAGKYAWEVGTIDASIENLLEESQPASDEWYRKNVPALIWSTSDLHPATQRLEDAGTWARHSNR